MSSLREQPWAADGALSQPTCDVVVERDVFVTMRDGIRLATDVYHPAEGGAAMQQPAPALLLRTPYGKRHAERGYASWFARRGYVAIVQDVRGTFDSEGELDLLVNEAEDGADTLAWIDTQDWSNGRVGTWGNSYASFTQLAAATQGPANLRSMATNQSASFAWRSAIRHGGAFELRWLSWAFWHPAVNPQRDVFADPGSRAAFNLGAPTTPDWLTRLPLRADATQLRLAPAYERWLLRLMQHTDETGFWTGPAMAPAAYAADMPACHVLLMGGWYDSYTRGTVELFDALSAQDHLDVHLLMGPWVHGQASLESSQAGDIDLGPDAAIADLRELHLRWFDRTLGTDPPARGHAADLPVEIFTMGGGGGRRTSAGKLLHGGQWRALPTWPVPDLQTQEWFFHGDGVLRREPPLVADDATTYRFDPAHPVPTIGGNVSSHDQLGALPAGLTDSTLAGGVERLERIVPPGGFDQVESSGHFGCEPPYLPLASRHDVLVFRSEALEADLEVTGPLTVRLFVSSTAVDTDFTAKLIDEYPPSPAFPFGFSLNISDSIRRLRYRDGGNAKLLEPGTVVELEIELYPTSNRFCSGHRIRVDISSSNFPRFDVNANTGEPLGTERRRNVADNTVHHSAVHPSKLTLPVRSTAEPAVAQSTPAISPSRT